MTEQTAEGMRSVGVEVRNASGTRINPATEETVSQLVQQVDNAIDQTAFDLNAAAFSGTTNISNDYELDNVEFNFTTTASRTILITTVDGTKLLNETTTDTSFVWQPSSELAFNGGDNLTVDVTQTGAACLMDCILKIKQGSNTLIGNPVLGAGTNLFGIPFEFDIEVAKGNVAGHSVFGTFGERENVAVVAKGEDVWEGTASEIPIPPSSGEQMTFVSTSANDTAGGTGVQSVEIMYLDGNGNQQIEEKAMNGTTPVDTTATDISFVNFFHADTVGSNDVAVGDITIYQKGDATRVYNIVKAGGNMSLTCKAKIPAGKTLLIESWAASQTGRKPTALRLRSTDHHGELHEGVFIFKDSVRLDGTAIEKPKKPPIRIPALSVVKVSAWADDAAGSVSAGFCGTLVDN